MLHPSYFSNFVSPQKLTVITKILGLLINCYYALSRHIIYIKS